MATDKETLSADLKETSSALTDSEKCCRGAEAQLNEAHAVSHSGRYSSHPGTHQQQRADEGG